MATSGSTDWSQTRDNIIQQALEINNAISVGDTPSSALVTMASTVLNTFVKQIETVHGVRLWGLEWAQYYSFSAPSEVTGTDSLIYTCIKNHTSASTNKPITGANWSTYWRQTGSTGGTWVTATPYTSTGEFTAAADTIGIEEAFIRNNGIDTPIQIVQYDEYAKIPDKSTFGVPNKLWLDNKISPTIYIYPHLEDTDSVIHYLRIRKLEDFDGASNDPDFPVYWIDALVNNLAYKISSRFKLSATDRSILKKDADESLMLAINGDREHFTEIRFSPRMRR